MEVRAEIDASSYEAVRRRLGDTGHVHRAMARTLDQAARIGEHSASLYAPERTRRLKREISRTYAHEGLDGAVEAAIGQGEVRGLPGGALGPLREGQELYPLFVHEGTGLFGRLHRAIRARRAKVMRFIGRTGLVYTPAVQGQRPRPYMREAYDDTSAYIEGHLDDFVRQLVDTDI